VSKFNSLSDLKKIKTQIAEQEALRVAEQAALRLAQTQKKTHQRLFLAAIGKVQPLNDHARAPLVKHRPSTQPLQLLRDEKEVLRSSLSDDFDVGTLLDTDADLSYARPGVGPDVTRRLRRGEWSVQRELDLHGLRTEDAREALAGFLRESQKRGLRCLRVVHGKGLGSPGKTPVLKNRVLNWLMQKNEVLAYVQAKPAEGGAGAVLVLLQPG
jgi:DNA-nicking Smr family endonuclease